MSEATEALIERVLGEHAYNDWPTCACEWQGDLDAAMDGVTSLFDQHRAHVAAAIAEALAERAKCPTCGPTRTEQHPRRTGVTRCSNCKEWLSVTEENR